MYKKYIILIDKLRIYKTINNIHYNINHIKYSVIDIYLIIKYFLEYKKLLSYKR